MKFLPIVFLISLTLILSKMDELTIFKALVCVNIITSRHQQDKELEPSTLSPIILTCYIKISDEQVQRLTESIEHGEDIPLSDKEIDDLMNIDSLKDLPESEVKKKGDELEEAIKEFQKIQEGYSESGDNDGYDDGYDDGDDDYDFEDGLGQKNNMTKKGFFRLIKKGIVNMGEILISSWYIIGILVLFYVLLLEIRRNNDPNNNDNEEDKEKKKEEKDNKEKKQENENGENKEEKIEEKTKDEKEEKTIKEVKDENEKKDIENTIIRKVNDENEEKIIEGKIIREDNGTKEDKIENKNNKEKQD